MTNASTLFGTVTTTLKHTLDNPAVQAFAFFGRELDISGNYAIVGSRGYDASSPVLDAGRAYIYNVTTGALLHTLDNPDSPLDYDQFGSAVSISGNYAIVGSSSKDDSTTATNSGRAYIYNVSTGALVHALYNPNAYSSPDSDNFGVAVAISGNYTIVGAPFEDDATANSAGKAYIFDVVTGSLVHTLDNPNADTTSGDDQFGYRVAISGNYAMVTALKEDDSGSALDSGKVYIYNVTTGALLHTLDNPNPYGSPDNDAFGALGMDIEGNYAIIGAYLEDDAGGTNSGKVYVYNVSTGVLVHTLDNPNIASTSTNDFFGFSASISGNYAIIGAYREDLGDTDTGVVYIFDIIKGSLVGTITNPNAYSAATSDTFGWAAAISGNYFVVGAPQENDAGGNDSGKAYIYNIEDIPGYDASVDTIYEGESGTNELVVALDHTLDNPTSFGTSVLDYFGFGVAVSGNYAIVGAYAEDDSSTASNSGKAYIYNVSTGALVHTLDNPNDFGSPDNDRFGYSVSISGNYAIVGAYQEDEAAATDSGKAYIFNVTTGALVHTLDNPNAYGSPEFDQFGFSVSISGNYAIVGAFYEEELNNSFSGKAYIFDVITGALVHVLNNPNAYNTAFNDQFGFRVAISGNYAIVGAHQEDEAAGTDSGKAYIFNVTTGALVHTLDNPNAYGNPDYDRFSQALGISGNYAIVGAPDEDSADGTASGAAYIFNVSTGQIVHTLLNPSSDTKAGDKFGYSVSISGNYAIVGAQEDDSTASNSGKVYIFNVTTGALVHTLDNPNAYGNPDFDQFGHSVSISGNYAIIGAYNEEDAGGSASGKAYIYNLEDVPGYDASVESAGQPEFIIDPTVYTAAFVASKNRLHKLDVSGGAFTVDMPLSPVEGDRVEFRFVNGSSPATNNLTFSKGATSAEIENSTADYVWNVNSPRTVAWIYTTEDGWIIR